MTMRGRHIYPHQFFYQRVAFEAVLYQVFDRNELEIPLAGYLFQLGQAGHAPVLVHYFYQHAGRLKAGQAGQVYRGFGMAAAAQYTTGLGFQRKNVARSVGLVAGSINA
jgi:hypothetical protein